MGVFKLGVILILFGCFSWLLLLSWYRKRIFELETACRFQLVYVLTLPIEVEGRGFYDTYQKHYSGLVDFQMNVLKEEKSYDIVKRLGYEADLFLVEQWIRRYDLERSKSPLCKSGHSKEDASVSK